MHKQDLIKILEIESQRINHLDSILFTIKGWAITLVTALVGLALKLPDSGANTANKAVAINAELGVLALLATIVFLFIDLQFRRVQLRHVVSAIKIKNLLSEETESAKLVWPEIDGDNPLAKRSFLKDYSYILLIYCSIILAILLLLLVAH